MIAGAVAAAGIALLLVGCAASDGSAAGSRVQHLAAPQPGSRVVRLLFGGDVMLGRGVARASASDPDGLLAGIRSQLSGADLALANLESPLTSRAHDPSKGPNTLEASPSSARLLARAGFDALAIANNHAGDAGPETIPDTMQALAAAGLVTVGAGRSTAQAYAPRIVEADGLRVALLAFDATGEGPRAGLGRPGVAEWNPRLARRAVRTARSEADVVAVGLQGGTEYVSTTDPYQLQIARRLAAWGADVVWGQGPHVVQPIRVLPDTHGGRPTVVATSLGNLVFDQHVPGTQRGALLEVLAGKDGVRAYRVGAAHAYPPVRFLGWRPPAGDAVALDGEWWTLARATRPAVSPAVPSLAAFPGRVVAAAVGDPEGTGGRQVVVAFRRPYRATDVSGLVPRRELVDAEGRTAHVGLYRLRDLRPLWVAGTLFRPVARVAACDGALAVAYSTLGRSALVGTGAWSWGGFGFSDLPELPGAGLPACANVDGHLDPVVLERTPR